MLCIPSLVELSLKYACSDVESSFDWSISPVEPNKRVCSSFNEWYLSMSAFSPYRGLNCPLMVLRWKYSMI